MSARNNKKGKSKASIIIICIVVFVAVAIFGNLIPVIFDNDNSNPTKAPSSIRNIISGDEAGNATILSKTVMIYLDGADLEEMNQNSTRTIKEIIDSGVDTERNNILLYTGGCNLWHDYSIPADKDCIYIIKNGALQLLKENTAQNVGDSNTLKSFMQYCVTNYPAQQYGLILHNHGGGPNNGVCADFRNNCDMLNMSELQNAFSSVGFGPDAKMEFVFFDACLMSSVEVAFSIKDYAHYMVASENVSYVYGSDYSFIKAIDQYNSGAQIGSQYVDCFYNASINLGNRLKLQGLDVYDITYSCIKLSEIHKLENAMNDLFKAANENASLEQSLAIAARYARGVMEYADSYGEATDTVYDLIDLDNWMTYAAFAESNLTNSVRLAISDAVVHNRANTTQMAGLTIYYPKNIKNNYSYNKFGFSEEYSTYIKNCYVAANATIGATLWEQIDTQVNTAPENTKLSVNLNKEQIDNFASAQYYILAKHGEVDHTFEDDEYIIVAQGNDCSLNGNVLTAEFDYRVPVVYDTENVPTAFFSPLYKKTTDNETVLYTSYASLIYVPDVEDFPGTRDEDSLNELAWQIENMRMDVAWLTMRENNDSLEILFGEIKEDNGMPSRMLVNPYDYQEINFLNPVRSVKYDENGKILPVSEWDVNNSLTLTLSAEIDDISIKLQPLPEDVEYYGVMVLKDIFGNQYSTDIIPLN